MSQKAFPDDKLTFSEKYLSFLNPYKIGNTLSFENSQGHTEIFIITKIDSTIVNTKGWFINQRPYKYVALSYNQIPSRQWTHENIERDNNNNITKTTNEDDELVSINIYPDNGEQSYHISFKNFRGSIKKENDTISTKPIVANNMDIFKYYKVENVAADLVKSSKDVKTIYIADDKGITAYQDQQGNWWTRRN